MYSKPHACPDWDGLFILPSQPEMKLCTCAPTVDRRKVGRPLGEVPDNRLYAEGCRRLGPELDGEDDWRVTTRRS